MGSVAHVFLHGSIQLAFRNGREAQQKPKLTPRKWNNERCIMETANLVKSEWAIYQKLWSSLDTLMVLCLVALCTHDKENCVDVLKTQCRFNACRGPEILTPMSMTHGYQPCPYDNVLCDLTGLVLFLSCPSPVQVAVFLYSDWLKD